MPDEPRDPRSAAATLREYLAGRDMPCDQCGYNLRGTQDVFCPECGTVIPRPPSDDIQRARMDPAQLRLWCPECDYVVTGVNAARCPECGAMKLLRFSGEKPRLPRRSWLRPRGLPTALWINAVIGFVVAATAGARLAASPTPFGAGGQITMAVAAGFALIPVAFAAVWWTFRVIIRTWSAKGRLAAAALASLIGIAGWTLGLSMIR